MARFVKFGAEVDEATLKQLRRGERELAILKQDAHAPLPLEREVVILFAAVNGFLDEVPIERLRLFEERLYAFVQDTHPEIFGALRETLDLPVGAEARLVSALNEFQTVFRAQAGTGTQSAQ
jgi:F-type H+-transporting ATPase subunit alpha